MSEHSNLAMSNSPRPETARSTSSTSVNRGHRTPGHSHTDADVLDSLGTETAKEHPHRAVSHQDLRTDATTSYQPEEGVLTLTAGVTDKPYRIHSVLLARQSPYFARLLAGPPIPPNRESLTFSDVNERAMGLFTRWIYGGKLSGPTDYQSFQHYMCLYILGQRFQIHQLQNDVMDHVRTYYRQQNMTAPPYRLEYVYENTTEPCQMRTFLTSTAAYRVLCEPTKGGLSDAMASMVARGGDLAVDFVNAMAELHGNGLEDARKGDNCRFHVHDDGVKCPRYPAEAWQST